MFQRSGRTYLPKKSLSGPSLPPRLPRELKSSNKVSTSRKCEKLSVVVFYYQFLKKERCQKTGKFSYCLALFFFPFSEELYIYIYFFFCKQKSIQKNHFRILALTNDMISNLTISQKCACVCLSVCVLSGRCTFLYRHLKSQYLLNNCVVLRYRLTFEINYMFCLLLSFHINR